MKLKAIVSTHVKFDMVLLVKLFFALFILILRAFIFARNANL